MAEGKLPFRSWYSNLGQLRLFFKDLKLIACTATATKDTKRKIFDILNIEDQNTFIIENSPERSNIIYSNHYIDNDLEFEQIFNSVIEKIKERKDGCPRTIIYCQTRKQTAIIWRAFKLALGKDMYMSGLQLPEESFVEMFHAGTPETSKQHILNSLSIAEGHARVLICTIAFGMGIDIKSARTIIHFGPSKNVECYLQECGRVGRDGAQSHCILLYNGLLKAHCSSQMKELVSNTERCRRQEILKYFPGNHDISVTGCLCCDICAQTCTCIGTKGGCLKQFVQQIGAEKIPYKHCKQRVVTAKEKEVLKTRLVAYRDTLRNESSKQVLYPNTYLEFGSTQIGQILNNAEKLFSVADIANCVEIWRSEYANSVLNIFSQVFSDIDTACDVTELIDMDVDVDDTLDPDWMDVRDDSFVNMDSFQSSSMFETTQEASLLDSPNSPLNISTVIKNIASEAMMSNTDII